MRGRFGSRSALLNLEHPVSVSVVAAREGGSKRGSDKMGGD